MLALGLLAIVQIVLLPGLVGALLLRLTDGLLRTLVLSFTLSVLANYVLVLVLALARVYTPAAMFAAILTWLFLTLSGLATGLSWLCYFRALQLGDASKVAPIDKLSVVFVLLFAAIFLHETLTLKTALGGTLIAAGAVILALK